MQQHEGQNPKPDGPKKPEPGARQTRLLLLVIAILLGLVTSQMLKRFT